MTFLLQQLLLEPRRTLDLNNEQLNQLISQARSSRLLASLATELQEAGIDVQLPEVVRRHLNSAVLVHEKQKRDLAYDCEKVQLALNAIGERLILLKGAAYMLGDVLAGRGRLVTDIDILVPRQRIDEAEKVLNRFGWDSSYINTYNERYYRKWSHEIPPLNNRRRGTTLDVHHNILPPTARPHVNADLLFNNLIEAAPGIFTLSLHDMVIHSATHLFHEGEFHHGLRDLWDMDRMLRQFPQRDPRFWDGLVARARELQLERSLFHALTYAHQIFQTPVPPEVVKDTGNLSGQLRKPLMDFLFLRAFRPDHPQCRLPHTSIALQLLYLRSHFLRMPLYLLLPHLARKAWMRFFEDGEPGERRPGKADL